MRFSAVSRVGALLLAVSILPVRAQPTQAQPDEPPVPNWSTAVETVNVHARPGPAVWHVTRGDSEVWILGTVGAMPKDLDWNKQYLSDLLDGAHAIIVPPSGSISLLEAGWFLLTHVGDFDMTLPRGQTLQPMVPEPVWTHFLAVNAAIGDKPDDYKTDMPLGAARRLLNRVNSHAKLIGSEPRATINKLASQKHVPEQPTFKFEVIPIVKEALKLSPQDQRPCFGEAVEDADRISQHAVAAAQAWAVGDVKGMQANYAESRLTDCMAGLVHSFGAVNQNRVAAYVQAIDDALNKPGKTIAVVEIGPLLRKDGVLEQLAARHIAIEGPAE